MSKNDASANYGIASLALPAQSVEILRADVEKLKQLDREKKPDATGLLDGLVNKLKLVGAIAQSTVALHEPPKQIAVWFGVPLPF